MKILILLFFSVFFVFAQSENLAEKKIEFYLKNSNDIGDIVKIEIFKEKFPEVFRFYPDLNPISPKDNPKLASLFSMKRTHPIEGIVKPHLGIDIVAKKNTPIYAAADGIAVRNVFYNGKAGNSVQIEHRYGFVSKYFHLSIFIVKNKEKVKKGQLIGFLGSSGASTAPHLHYEILKNGKHINPYHFVKSIPKEKLQKRWQIFSPFGSKITDFGGKFLRFNKN